MAEFKRLPTQAELEQILFMSGIRPQSTADIVSQNLAPQTIKPLPQNVFQKIAGGAGIAREAVNRLGNASDVAKLFPGYTGQSQVTIPTGFNFAPKQTPTGEVTPGGLQTQQVNVNELLKAIKPADVLGISGAERAYSDIGAGRAPQPMDVVDTLALGAGGVAGVKGAAKTGIAAGKYAAPEVGRMAEQYAIKSGLISPLDAYHGSPYTFDEFDISKVNTGERSQAYGHGMYFAEEPGVARGYKESLSGGAKKVLNASFSSDPELWVAGQLYSNVPKKSIIDGLDALGYKGNAQDLLGSAKERLQKELDVGNLYKVDIPDAAVSTFLDWDKKISSQKQGQKALQELNNKYGFGYDDTFTGGELYKALTVDLIRTGKASDQLQAQKLASDELNSIGVQGIKYLDQESRKGGKGTRNFVVFDPSIVKILERNDKPVK